MIIRKVEEVPFNTFDDTSMDLKFIYTYADLPFRSELSRLLPFNDEDSIEIERTALRLEIEK